uniref:Uncharacterized protein n=1 Tax=Ditylenchus dipsaci TaxID=166011 RepID=A0A915D7E2_9BILA
MIHPDHKSADLCIGVLLSDVRPDVQPIRPLQVHPGRPSKVPRPTSIKSLDGHGLDVDANVVKVGKQRLVYYDSLHGDGSRYLSQVTEFLRVDQLEKVKGLDATNWLPLMDKKDMNRFREQMAMEVVTGELKKN